MHIVLVEDDWLQAEWIESRLRESFHNVETKRISTEQEFNVQLAAFVVAPPDVFIIDVMLRWANPEPDMAEPPTEVQENGYFRAGLRCKDKIIEHEHTRNTPIILYTVLEELDLDQSLQDKPVHVVYLRKDSDPEPLIRKIRELMRR
jgi:CheY-like chemotaxis protein